VCKCVSIFDHSFCLSQFGRSSHRIEWAALHAGALADALEAIANQAHLLSHSLAADFSRRLLALFSDFTMACKSLQSGPPLDSMALLPALAAACAAVRSTAANGAAAGTYNKCPNIVVSSFCRHIFLTPSKYCLAK
jgi:hypothetical protein